MKITIDVGRLRFLDHGAELERKLELLIGEIKTDTIDGKHTNGVIELTGRFPI